MVGAPSSFNVLAKPTGAICNLDCDYCFFLAKEEIYPGGTFRMAEPVLISYARGLLDEFPGVPEGTVDVIPVDIVVAREFKAGAESQTVGVLKCPPDAMILDAGPQTVAELEAVFAAAKTLIWNGPLGAFEIEP